jgi:AdoMet-dependent heme synthase
LGLPVAEPAASLAGIRSSAPCLLYVDGRPRILAVPKATDRISLHARGGEAEATGAFAASVGALLANRADTADLQRLRILESAHPWLRGLHRSRPEPDEGLTAAVLPLGMLFVEMTARCNERCIHCYAESGPDRAEHLSLGEIRAALDMAAGLGKPFVQFTGGDPLIHPHIVEAVAHAHALDTAGIEVYTNGLLLNDAMISRLAPFAPRLCFSVYADEPDIHDAITRVPGSWKKTLAAMHRAQDAGLDIRAGIALMDENLDRAAHMEDFLQRELDLEGPQIRFDPVKQAGRGRPSPRLQQVYADGGHVPDKAEAPGKLCIAADGNVYPCIFARHTPLGNIRSATLDEIMESLSHRRPAAASAERWTFCRDSLSCIDCRMNVYALGVSSLERAD